MNRISFFFSYLRYYLNASTKHDIHSPFVFDLLTRVIQSKEINPAWKVIEQVRLDLLNSKEVIAVTDLGAGSLTGNKTLRKVSDIARHASKNRKYGQLLSRLTARFQPANMLELGTSLGLSALYQHAGIPAARLTTMEGCLQTASLAERNFSKLKADHITIKTGNFDETLPAYLSGLKTLEYVFFDGNHRKEPTLAYFKSCLTKAGSESLFIFDDIHWSPEMEDAWKQIKAHPEVTVTIDLFFLGLVFFRKGQEKQDFTLRF